MSRNIDVIGIGRDLLINREQFRFAYIRREVHDETEKVTFSTVLVFDGGPDGELVIAHPDASSIESVETAREVLHDFHGLLVTLS